MSEFGKAFFGVTDCLLVVNGVDEPIGDNLFFDVYSAMMAQVYMDFASLPSPREISCSEIRWFYNALREGLRGKGPQD